MTVARYLCNLDI